MEVCFCAVVCPSSCAFVFVCVCVCVCELYMSVFSTFPILLSFQLYLPSCLVLSLLDPVVCCVWFVTHEDRSRSASAPMLGTVLTLGHCSVEVVFQAKKTTEYILRGCTSFPFSKIIQQLTSFYHITFQSLQHFNTHTPVTTHCCTHVDCPAFSQSVVYVGLPACICLHFVFFLNANSSSKPRLSPIKVYLDLEYPN